MPNILNKATAVNKLSCKNNEDFLIQLFKLQSLYLYAGFTT
jgi:hypothetical protein